MAKVNEKKLDELIASAGIGAEEAAKLRSANSPVERRPRGHGPARESRMELDEI